MSEGFEGVTRRRFLEVTGQAFELVGLAGLNADVFESLGKVLVPSQVGPGVCVPSDSQYSDLLRANNFKPTDIADYRSVDEVVRRHVDRWERGDIEAFAVARGAWVPDAKWAIDFGYDQQVSNRYDEVMAEGSFDRASVFYTRW
tara:strand:+ start:685 stop:1116 length:432 start_codon:yes stop_codon:yes gene_type:complete